MSHTVTYPSPLHPAYQSAAVGGVRPQDSASHLFRAGERHPSGLLPAGEGVFHPQADRHLRQRQPDRPMGRQPPAGLSAPLHTGGLGLQLQAAPQHGRQAQQHPQHRQGQGKRQQETGQISDIEKVEQQSCGQEERIGPAAAGHGGYRSLGGWTMCSTSPRGSCCVPSHPGVRTRRWATVSRKMSATSSGIT